MKKYKLLSILTIVITLFMFQNKNVYAEEPEACAHTLDDECYAETLGLSIDVDDDVQDKLTITVNHDYKDATGSTVVYEVLSVDGKAVKKSNGKPYKVSYNSKNHNIELPVKFKSTGNVIRIATTKNVHVRAKDGYEEKTGKIYITVSISESSSISGKAKDHSGEGSLAGLKELSVGVKNIDCSHVDVSAGNSIYDEKYAGFREKFCFAKKSAKGANNLGKINEDGFKSTKIFSNNYCSVDAKKYTAKFGNNDFDKQYYQNIKYYYARSVHNENNLGHYEYNYSFSEPEKSNQLTCQLECQESVTVEYGPPVAVKAGLCFEYRVKVTSRVYCWVKTPPDKPKHPTGYCTPGPTCYHSGIAYRQGGPNEEFDACVKECDGGKYTQKCSNKCYEKVYGKNLTSYEAKKTASAAVEACAKSSGYHGCYYRESQQGRIRWWGQKGSYGTYRGGTGDYAPGRWYEEHVGQWGVGNVYYVPLNDGFYRAQYSSGYCHDSCGWYGCDWNKYLNPGQADKDWEANKDIYNKAIETCEARATSNTTTTTYEISASYYRAKDDKGNKEKIVVHFPYSGPNDVKLDRTIEQDSATTPDKLKTCKDSPTGNSDRVAKKKSTIFDYGMCYGETCPKDKIGYMTAWTFPGSYENIKTGEISYNPQYYSDEAWENYEDRFCVPKHVFSINSYWYQWYFHQVEKTNTSEYDKICLNKTTKEVISTPKYSSLTNKNAFKIKEYNIYAKTRKFGYFKWNFDIRCFFAVDKGDNSDVHGEETTIINDSTKDKCQTTQYRIRTVTTNDLFPDGKNTDGTVKNRTVGYNWKDESSLANQDLPESYKVLPSTTLNTIQTLGNQIYEAPGGNVNNNKYVDYQFTLTPELLRKIKNYNTKLSAYDIYCGKMQTNDKRVKVYRSNLFRSGNGINDASIAACKSIGNGVISGKLGTPGVNNQ